MDVAFVSEFDGGSRVFRYVDAASVDSVVRVDGSDPLDESYCQRVVDGRLPEVIPDAAGNAEAASLPVTSLLPVGAHLSVPITRADGSVFGTLCCFKHEPDESLTERDGAVMHLFAALVGEYLEQEDVPVLATPNDAPGVRPQRPRDRPRLASIRDEELRSVQLVGSPAVGVLALCTVLFALEHLLDFHLLPSQFEVGAAALGLTACLTLVVLGLLWRGVRANVTSSFAELDRRRAVDHADQSAFDLRRRQVIEVLEATDTMQMVFQPVFDLSDGSLVGHEALARFAGDRTPDVWFAEAHAVGLGIELELLAVTEAIRTFDGADGYLAVNVSPAALSSAPLQNFLERSPDTRRLVLELTEHAVIEDYELIAGCVVRLRHLGARLAIDDAGSGFASMRHIVDLAPDIVKIDRSIVDRVDTDAARAALVDSLVQLANKLGATVVAEGIERPEELETSRRHGVQCGQGYLLGRPAAVAASRPLTPVERFSR
jgi:EAL domain-containing protein (putative c-di-GMP-specific phosphodiesterase class I)